MIPPLPEIAIHHIEPFRTRGFSGAIASIYRDAYNCPEDDLRSFIQGAFARHATWPGFLLLVATFEDLPVGFIYGYVSQPGQWWHDIIRPAMIEAGHARWQDDAFELAEVAVAPAVQGRGIGTALIEAFLAAAPDQTMLLSTDVDGSHRARDLYQRFGFVDLVPEFRYPGFDDLAIIMGRRSANGRRD